MKRRAFLQKSLPAGILLPSFMNGFSFRAFGMASPELSALLQPVTETDHVLVIVQLNGGNDGLNTVIPIEYFNNYVNARSNVYIPQDKVLPLNGKVGLHPAMTGMGELYKDN
jgi:uncharacterized protein (DUF1501 family)